MTVPLKNNALSGALKYPPIFKETVFKNKMGRTYPMYEMNKQAYMKLAMQLKGYEKAEVVQDMIIEAFSIMETALNNYHNQSWIEARKQGKLIRRQETDIIQEFVEYATEQGSNNAHRYYSNITKMTNKALEYLVQVKEGVPIRDFLEVQEHFFCRIVR